MDVMGVMDDCYRGVRQADGKTIVFRPNGSWLPGRPPSGFRWGTEGNARALARELLVDHFCGDGIEVGGPLVSALAMIPSFLERVVAKFPRDGWKLTGTQMREAIAEIESESATKNTSERVSV